MRTLKLSLLALTVAAFAACNPTVRGLCDVDTDCPESMTCELGICVGDGTSTDSDGGDKPADGGEKQCVPACATGSTCVAGTCVPNNDPFVVITSPASNSQFPAQVLTVVVRARGPSGVTKLDVNLTNSAGFLKTYPTAPTGAPDEFEAQVELTDPAVDTGEYGLVAVLNTGDVKKNSEVVVIRVVKSGPVINVLPIDYPARTDGHPSTGAFLRNEMVVIQAIISDDGVGLGNELPVLTVAGMEPVQGILTGPRVFVFKFDARKPPFNFVINDVPFEITAKNAIGLTASAQGTFKLSRWKWTWTKQRNGPIKTAPALSKGLLFLGSDDNYVYAIHPSDGSQAWDFNAASPVIGHITAGESRIYAATKEGRVYALDPVDAPISDTQRRVYRCPDATGGFGQPQLREFRTGVALAKMPISSSNASTEETLFAFTSDGHLRMLRQTAFPQPFGPSSGCVWEGAAGNWPTFNSNDAVVPTLVPNGNDMRVYLADMGGVVRRVTVKLGVGGSGQTATYLLSQDWSKSVGGAVHGSLAYGNFSNGTGVLAMREDSKSYGFDVNGGDLWTSGNRALPGQSRMPPSLTSQFGFVVDMNGNLAGLKLNDGQPAGTPVPLNAVSTKEANAGAITGSDGRVYYGSGTKLQSIALGGVIEWIFEPTPSGSELTYVDLGTPALGCDGTLYVTASNSKKGYVHALITDSTGGMIDGPWTRPMHDNRNTSNASAPLSTGASCTD